jgi:flavodoxin
MATIKILVGTVYGGSRDVAEHVKPELEAKGYRVDISEDPSIADLENKTLEGILIVCSTTGSGDFPPNFDKFYHQLQENGAALSQLKYGIISLGDSSYDETFCDAGKKMDAVLAEYGGQRIGRPLEIDSAEHFDATEPAGDWIGRWIDQLQQTEMA